MELEFPNKDKRGGRQEVAKPPAVFSNLIRAVAVGVQVGLLIAQSP